MRRVRDLQGWHHRVICRRMTKTDTTQAHTAQPHPATPVAAFGSPPDRLAMLPASAAQYSPMVPGSAALEEAVEASLGGMVMLAAPGTLERRHDMAAMLRAIAPGSTFTVMAPKDMGGARLASELAAFGCAFMENAKAHHKICTGTRPDALVGLAEAIADGAPRRLADLGLWSQPGIFSWNRIDPGTALLLGALPRLTGRGADFGCGIGVLAHGVLASSKVTALALLDIDRRAVAAARRNVDDARASFAWTDVRAGTGLSGLDFVVMNPPFHDATGGEDKGLGQAFIRRAAEALRGGGHLWLTANRHLPYEAALKPLFRRVTPVIEAGGFKVVEAQK